MIGRFPSGARPGGRRDLPRRRAPGQTRARQRLAMPPLRFVVLSALLALCVLGGGTAFADVPSLLYVRPAALIALGVFLLAPPSPDQPPDWRAVRAPLLFLAAFALLMAVQLVPLPPAVWTALPGRLPYAALAQVAGVAQPWRPLSLTPDLTANSLVALIVPAAVLVGYAGIDARGRGWLVVGLIGLCCASAVLGVAQFAAGGDSVLYLYRRTYNDFPVGFLSNRNHHAVLLATLFPALRVWTLFPAGRAAARYRPWLALALGALAVPVILATGSRTGFVLAAVSLALTLVLFPPAPDGAGGRVTRLVRVAAPVLLAALVALSWWLGRAASLQRFSSVATIEADQRFEYAPVVARIARETFPAGTGFGGFDIVFRQYEPDSGLISTHFNHAHNELLEMAMTAGLPGLLLVGAFLLWVAVRIVTVWRRPDRGPDRAVGLLGAMVVVLLLAASLTDYPLRTPLLSAVFALACGWLGAGLAAAPRRNPDDTRVASQGDLR